MNGSSRLQFRISVVKKTTLSRGYALYLQQNPSSRRLQSKRARRQFIRQKAHELTAFGCNFAVFKGQFTPCGRETTSLSCNCQDKRL
jgi:hypothetical protein